MAQRMPRVALVHCAGGSTLREGITREDLPHDCKAILEAHPEGIQACTYGCLGGGSCVAACRFDAIHINERGVAEVDRDKCRGCGACARVCPQHLIEVVPKDNTILVRCSNHDKGPLARKECTSSCISCSACERACSSDAIHVTDFLAVMDQASCIACGMCATKCPRGVIRDAHGILTAAR